MTRWLDYFKGNDLSTNLRAIMGGVFVVFGISILFGSILPAHLNGNFQNIMGLIMIGHGIFRIVHIPYKKNLERKHNEEGDYE